MYCALRAAARRVATAALLLPGRLHAFGPNYLPTYRTADCWHGTSRQRQPVLCSGRMPVPYPVSFMWPVRTWNAWKTPNSFVCMHVAPCRIDSSLGDANFVHPIAVLVSQQTALVGWTYEVRTGAPDWSP